jgi:CDP-paratose 2-epimerase
MKYRDILITGGAGFVGSHLAVRLKLQFPSASVTAFDNLKRRGSEYNLPRLSEQSVRFVHGDVRCAEDLRLSGGPHDLIIDCSAEPSVLAGYGLGAPAVIQNNLVGTINCLEQARSHDADFLFLSTSRVYSIKKLSALDLEETSTRFVLRDRQSVPGAGIDGINEEFPTTGHRSLYGATKLASELLIEEYRHSFGLRAIINRCGVIAGPWQMGKVDQGVFSLWLLAHYFGLPLKYIGFGGTGKQVRDLLHVEDLCRLIELQLSQMEHLDGCVFNVGGGAACSLSLQETTALCQEITGNRVEIRSESENRPGDVPLYLSDTTRVHSLTGWCVQSDPATILADICRWVRSHEAQLRSLIPTG